MTVYDFIPPILMSLLHKLRARSSQRQYDSFSDAMADCSKYGYENSELIDVIVEKTRRYRDTLWEAATPIQLNTTLAYSLCSLLAPPSPMEINVLDFGGAAGAHYFLARSMLPSSRKLNWTVVETAAMVQKAQPLFAGDELNFSSDLDVTLRAMGQIDIIHSSATLQCVDTPYQYLQKLVSAHARYILLNRLGLTRGDHDVITVHESWLSENGQGPMPDGVSDKKVRYPFVFPKESIFMDILSRNHQIVSEIDDSSGIFPVGDEPIIGRGLLVKRKA